MQVDLLFQYNGGQGDAVALARASASGRTPSRAAAFFMMRPLAASTDASPAPLRLSVKLAMGGINNGFLKRQGPGHGEPLFLPMWLEQFVTLPQRTKPACGSSMSFWMPTNLEWLSNGLSRSFTTISRPAFRFFVC